MILVISNKYIGNSIAYLFNINMFRYLVYDFIDTSMENIEWDRYQWEYPFIFTHGKICKGKDMHTVMRDAFSHNAIWYIW